MKIKNKNSMTDAQKKNSLRIALSKIEPNIDKLMKKNYVKYLIKIFSSFHYLKKIFVHENKYKNNIYIV